MLIQDAPGWVSAHARARGLESVYAFHVAWNDTSRAAFMGQAVAIVAAVDSLRHHDGIIAWVLGNEIPAWVVQELGATEVESRLRDIAAHVRQRDPGRLLGHANWPPTKELDLSFLDLACFNLYPAWPYEVTVKGYGPYLREVLVPLARGHPLLVTEFGINSLEAAETRQAQVLADCWREIAAGPAIGGVVFEWADEWWKNFDNPITGKGYWERAYASDDAKHHDQDPEEYYGIVRADRGHKPAYASVQAMWSAPMRSRSPVPWLVLAALGASTWWAFNFGRRRQAAAGNPAGKTSVACLIAVLAATAPAGAHAASWAQRDTVTGANADDQFGWTLAGAGDVDGDGRGDAAVGAHFYMVGPDTAAGAVYVYRGGQPAGSPAIVRLEGPTPHEHFGESICGGRDADGDGIPDLAVGASQRAGPAGLAAGAVDLFRGGAALTAGRWTTLYGEAANDWFGQSVAMGDVDGDGLADVIVGAPYNDRGGSAAGAVFIYRGGMSPPLALLQVLIGEAPNDQFGWSAAYLGDINGDGYGDIAVGARLHGVGLKSAAGKVYLFYGGPTMDAIPDGTWMGVLRDDWFGNSVAGPGDVDGGGRPDILVGAPYNDAGGSAAGAAYLFRGEDSPGSPPAATYLGESPNAQFGWSVGGAGDVNADVRADIVVGARLQASGLLIAAGRAYLFGGGSPLSTTPLGTADGEAANDWLGNCVDGSPGYFSPGHGTLFVGAPYNDAAASAGGRAYLLGPGGVVGIPDGARRATSLRARPNPTVGPVTILWIGRRDEPAGVEIVDAGGRRVRRLTIRGYGARWDTRDEAGTLVPAGLYFVRSLTDPPTPVRIDSQARLVVLR